MSTLKPSIYNDFHCIADRCTFSCCCNWNIVVDDRTMKTYRNDPFILQGIDADAGHMRTDEAGRCYFLNEQGLCNLVLKYGEEGLCDTCARFPRQYIERQGIQECSLSNACPKVLAMLHEAPVPLSFVLDGDCFTSEYEALHSVQIRDTVIGMLQLPEIPLWSRMFMSAFFLNKIVENGSGAVETLVRQYSSAEFAHEVHVNLGRMDYQEDVFLRNIHFLFYVVNVNVSWSGFFADRVKGFCEEEPQYVRDHGWDAYSNRWRTFRQGLEQYRDYIENVCVNYVFRNLVSEEYKELDQMMKILIVQIALSVYNMFLIRYSGEDYNIYDVFCYYSRILGHNRENAVTMLEALDEQLDWGMGDYYLLVRGLEV